MVSAALRVTNDRKARFEVGHHACRDFTRIGALLVRGNVLRAPHDTTAAEQRLRLREVRTRHAYANARVGGQRLHATRDGFEQCRIGREAAMHLPVTDYELRSLFRWLFRHCSGCC